MRTRLAQLFAKQEGFGKPGTQPTLKHNPGDLRHSPHSSHEGEGKEDIGIIDTDAHGWDDLERQLALFAERGMTVREAVYVFAPPKENNSFIYLRNICQGFPCSPDDLIKQLLLVQVNPEEPKQQPPQKQQT